MLRTAFLSLSIALLAAPLAACAGGASPTHEAPLPTEEDTSLPPDRSPGYHAEEAPLTSHDAPLPEDDAGAHADASPSQPPSAPPPDAGGEPPPPPPDASAPGTPAGSVCNWVRLYGPCPPPPGNGNDCVPAVYGYAHWELECHAPCPAGTSWNGSGCLPSF